MELLPNGKHRVVRVWRQYCVWFSFENPGQNEGADAEVVRKAIEDIGGHFDRLGYTNMVLTIPAAVGFPRIKGLLQDLEKRIIGTEWMFGNVFDPGTGTPLRCWEVL